MDYCAASATIHTAACVDRPCRIGDYTVINRYAHVMTRAIIGDSCYIGQNVTIGAGVMIGHHVRILNNSMILSGAILENGVYWGPSTVMAPLDRLRANHAPLSRITPTLAREGATIAAHGAIAAGVTLGRFCFIEAGGVVDRNIPDFAVACGNPITLIGWRCECGAPLTFQDDRAACLPCARRYVRESAEKVTLASPPTPGSVERRHPG